MECVLKCGKPCDIGDSIDNIKDDKWSNVKSNAEQWKGLDKFGDVWDTTNWENGQKGRYMHSNCYITLCSSKKRGQAITRNVKKREAAKDVPVQDTSHLPPFSPIKKKTRLSTGAIQENDRCVWCMKKEDKKHPGRSSSKLLRIQQTSRWQDFKRHIPFLKDIEMRRRITTLVDSTLDPFATGIRYHRSCWNEHIFNNKNDQLGNIHLQDINIDDARKLFFRHVDEVIFKKREIRQLQWLHSEY